MKCTLEKIYKLPKHCIYGYPIELNILEDDHNGRAIFLHQKTGKFVNVHYLKSGDIYKVDDELEY